MKRWTPDLVAVVLESAFAGGDPPSAFTSISTDTRTLEPGALFVALAGENFDGHDHLVQARDRGAAGAVVRSATATIPGIPLIRVADTLVAYGRLGRERRRSVGGPVIAITGSNGKTSTREMVAAVLRTAYRTHANAANLNNLVGIPQTLLAMPDGCGALVIEAGASQPGELVRAREILEPTIVIITNVTEAHLEGFGSLAGVMEEKVSLAAGAPLAITGTDPPDLAAEAARVAGKVITAGLKRADVVPVAFSVDENARAVIWVDGQEVKLPAPGPHQAANAMLAWAVVRELGLSFPEAAAGLEGITLPGGRGEILRYGNLTIIHDAYNANPLSFRAAMETARAMRAGRRLVFVAGTMRELGRDSAAWHETIARELVDLEPDLLAGVGDFAAALEPWRGRLGDRLLTARDPLELGPVLAGRLSGNEIIVLKASRGVALERILPWLSDRPAPPS